MMKGGIIFILILIILANSCINEFEPDIAEVTPILVVEGLLTDQQVANKVKLSSSMMPGEALVPVPVTGAQVRIQDDQGNTHRLTEKEPGCYYTNPAVFKGIPGRKYALFIDSYVGDCASPYCEMVPVPPIDSVYYEKVLIKTNELGLPVEGCQIYVDTHDETDSSKFFRWDYTETWIFKLPYDVPNNICWRTSGSDRIYLANTTYLAEPRISRFPLIKIPTETDDRLQEKYSVLVNQYSLNEDEFRYWEKIEKIAQQSGGLYDVTPMTIEGNMRRLEDPSEKVLGYFSVSAISSQRIFIKDIFKGFKDPYKSCAYETLPIYRAVPGIGETYWVIIWDYDLQIKVITDQLRCVDCTTRGSTEKPDFWP